MTEKETLVFADLDGVPHLMGRLWARVRKDRESATFEHDKRWLANPVRFSLEPALHLGPGPYHTAQGRALFGAIGDSAPDRWGRVLMRRAERRRAAARNETPRTIRELEYLLLVDDESRQGALRFAEREAGPFLCPHGRTRIPPLLQLPSLLSAAEHIASDTDTAEDLRLLLAPGSSLGGARPKASIRDRDRHLAIAKFPNKGDDVTAVLWEALALTLASQAGIPVPKWRVETVAGTPVLILRRFDRKGTERIPFLSAMSMLGATDNEQRSYLEFVDILRQHGATPKQDMQELWRRIVFNILISNVDDHLRNHGFLYAGPRGWQLSPAYDMNPVPVDLKPRVLSTAIDHEDSTASLELALSVCDYFELPLPRARAIASEVGQVVKRWRCEAANLTIPSPEVERMASAFEHRDLAAACTMLSFVVSS